MQHDRTLSRLVDEGGGIISLLTMAAKGKGKRRKGEKDVEEDCTDSIVHAIFTHVVNGLACLNQAG
jgi:hypothetical protein